MTKKTPPPREFVELLAERRPLVAALALGVRDIVARVTPGAQELVYSNYAVVDAFTFTGSAKDHFCHVVAYEKHVNVGFTRGAELPDGKKLLAGTGKKIRHIRVASDEDLKLPIASYVRAAAKLARR